MAAGKKTGGRQKGSQNKRTRERTVLVTKALSEGISPLDVMLGAMRDAWQSGKKAEAATYARDAAPYLHPKLSSIEHKGDPDNPLETVTHIVLTSPETDDSTDRTASQAHPGIHGPS